MTVAQPILTSVGLSTSRWDEVRPCLLAALKNLGLDKSFGSVRISADDLPSQGDAWYHLERPLEAGALATLVVICHPHVFSTHQPLNTTANAEREIWESVTSRDSNESASQFVFSQTRAEAFVHHHLLIVQDILNGELVPEMVPKTLVEAFGSVWSVVVDGRLQRQHLPGYDVAERRGYFSRLFSTAGILLPGHWQLFQAFWDGSITEQEQVLEAIRQLPRL